MLRTLLYKYLLKAVLVALVVLLLYGIFPGTSLIIILVLFVVARVLSLAGEWMRIPIPPFPWEKLNPGVLTQGLKQPEPSRVRNNLPPRSKRELGAEVVGVIAFAILIPLNIALYTRDFFSFRESQGWQGAVVAAGCVALYAWPRFALKSSELAEIRILWWALPFVIGSLALSHVVETRHRYLNPFDPDHNRLAAEKVLSLKNNIVAGHYADWVLRYARQLDRQAETVQAIRFYREGLRLDANDQDARARLAGLEAIFSGDSLGDEPEAHVSASAPYWSSERPIINPPRRRIDSGLENVPGCTVVIVAVGRVSEETLNAVGYTIHNELSLPVYISPDSIALPEYTRKRGLAVDPQWSVVSIVQAFTNSVRSFPEAPIRYVLLTSADIYVEEANYAFSAACQWGGVVSTARFAAQPGEDALFLQRSAKQSLCMLLKSFNIPASPDRNCVTSYSRTLDEFDAKGNRPDAETTRLFRHAVDEINESWQERQKGLNHLTSR